MRIDNRILDNLGVQTVTGFIENRIFCGWQDYFAKNDNAFDGMIIMRKGRSNVIETGGVIFVQIKCGKTGGYKVLRNIDPDHIGVKVGSDYIESHRERWNKVESPSILIFIDADNYNFDNPDNKALDGYWVDLKDNAAYCQSNRNLIRVPKKNKLNLHTKSEFHKLCGDKVNEYKLDKLFIKNDDCLPIALGKNTYLKKEAWNYYKNWALNTNEHFHPKLGRILVNRMGWKHITRKGRANNRIVASWLLLPVARKMIRLIKDYQRLGERIEIAYHKGDGLILVRDYLSLKALVSFTYRDSSLVQVILKRDKIIDIKGNVISEKIWFYSVFEKRRGEMQ